jgi:hypothetical protein
MVRTSERIGWKATLVHGLLPVGLILLLGVRRFDSVVDGGLINPDSYMRMVRLREILGAAEPVHGVGRDVSGTGAILHWSHLLDSLLLAIAAPFVWLLGSEQALHVAALTIGPISLAALGIAVAWAAAPFADRRWLWLAPLVACMAPAIGGYGWMGVVHHHVAIVVVAVVAGGWAARVVVGVAPRWAGLAIGAWSGIGLWLTPETLPLTTMAFGGLWVAWLTDPDRDDIVQAIWQTGTAFLLTVSLGVIIDPPLGGWGAPETDRISILFAVLAGAMAATGGAIVAIHSAWTATTARLLASATFGLLACLGWIMLFPDLTDGLSQGAADVDTRAMWSHINEMKPVTTFESMLRHLLTGILACAALIFCAIERRSLVLLYVVCCAGGLLVLGALHVRFAAYPGALGAVMVPIIIAILDRRMAARPAATQSLTRVGTICLFVLVPFASGLPTLSKAAQAKPAPTAASCAVSELGGMLAPYAGQVVLTNVNDAPELLHRTGILTVGSLYHRNQPAFLRLRSAWRSLPSETVPREFTAAGIALVLFCPSSERSVLVADLSPDTLLDRLGHGDVPVWLVRVADDTKSGHILYKVTP